MLVGLFEYVGCGDVRQFECQCDCFVCDVIVVYVQVCVQMWIVEYCLFLVFVGECECMVECCIVQCEGGCVCDCVGYVCDVVVDDFVDDEGWCCMCGCM